MKYEDFLRLVQSRRSVRQFSAQPVSGDVLRRVLEAARWAPSNHNRQPWRFLVLPERQPISRLAQAVEVELSQRLAALPQVASEYVREFAHYATFFAEAPVLLVVLHKKPASFSAALLQDVPHPELVSGEPLSTAMAVQNLLLAAHTLGLGSCVLTAPLVAHEAVLRALNPPAGYELTCLVALGYPAETPVPPRRKSIEQIAEFREDSARNS